MENQVTSSILEMAQGAIKEQTDIEVGKIIENILNLNTSPSKKRTLTLKVDFEPNENRTQVVIKASATSKLQGNNAIQTALCVGVDTKSGELIATELIPNMAGQTIFGGSEQEDAKVIKIHQAV